MENKTIQKANEVIMNTYARFPIVIEKGEGVYLYDDYGKKYLDFVAGIAVNCLGYGHEGFISAINKQLHDFNHVSNLYWTKPGIEAAEKLTKYTDLDQVFYCNSGAEAVEAALKLSRIYSIQNKGSKCHEVISLNHSFHGRTMGALSLTGQEKYHKNLTPLLQGIKRADLNDMESVKKLVTENTAAIIVEPLQGEGGIHPSQKEFLQGLRNLCDEKDIVLIFDEVQSGIGRTGKLFAFQHYGITPDIVTSAKGLGNGVPIGAIVAKKKISQAFTPGTHASTFGGNGIACAAANVVLDELMENGLVEHVNNMGIYLNQQLLKLKEKFPVITDVRGMGLMQGIELEIQVAPIINKCIEKGLLLVGAGANVIRFVPPLIISNNEIMQGIEILAAILEEF